MLPDARTASDPHTWQWQPIPGKNPSMKQPSAERCREEAALHRKMADKVTEPEVRAKLLQTAQAYETLARSIDKITSNYH
jgi:hypothetical protein